MKMTQVPFVPQAILPFYLEHTGDITLLLERGHFEMMPFKIETFLKRQFRTAKENHEYYNQHFGRLLHRKRNLPLFMHETLYVPFKVRVPCVKGDAATGYVMLSAIEKIEGDCIALKESLSLLLCMSEKSAYARFTEARLAGAALEERPRYPSERERLAEDLARYLLR